MKSPATERFHVVVLIAFACAALLCASGLAAARVDTGPLSGKMPVVVQLRPTAREAYRASVYIDGEPAAESESSVDIVISRWTTPEGRNNLLSTLMVKGEQQARTQLSRQRPAGYVQLTTGPRYELKYAWPEQEGGVRRIVLLSDRVIPFVSAWNATHAFKYRITAIQLQVDEAGNGSGTADVGVTIRVPPETLQLIVENPSTDTIELRDVSRVQ